MSCEIRRVNRTPRKRAYDRNPSGRTLALSGARLISCACCVSTPALQQPRQASPERVGEYSQTSLFYRGVWKSVKPVAKNRISCTIIYRMPELTTLFPETEAPPVEASAAGPSRRLRLMGLVAVLSVSFVHFVIGAVYSLFHADKASQRYQSQIGVLDALLAELISLLLLWFVLSNHGRKWADIGWTPKWGDLAHGVILIVGSRAAGEIAVVLFQAFFQVFTGNYLQPRSTHGIISGGVSALTFLIVIVNPFFEELIVRGYTMTEVMALGGSRNLAIFISVLVQMSYHVYQGFLRCVGLTAVFLLFSIYFSRTRRIGPVIVAHFWSDAIALIRLAR